MGNFIQRIVSFVTLVVIRWASNSPQQADLYVPKAASTSSRTAVSVLDSRLSATHGEQKNLWWRNFGGGGHSY